jgi:hypothetical protein
LYLESFKEKLCRNFDDDDVIAEWVGTVESEGRVLEAIVRVLNKTSNSMTNVLETIRQAKDNVAFQLCLDPSSLNICTAGFSNVADDVKVMQHPTKPPDLYPHPQAQ